MNIKCKTGIEYKTQEEFYLIDKIVTGLAFDIHNQLGRFCHEKIYQKALSEKCRKRSLNTESEVEICLTYNDYKKVFKIDFLVENGVIYEFKTVESLNNTHKQQLINYLLLTNLSHGKLINFRPTSVEYEFVSTTLTENDRFNYTVDITEWCALTDKCSDLRTILSELLLAWGVYLDYNLFNEALVHFLSKTNEIIKPVKIYMDKYCVGEQNMQLLDNKTVLHFSGISKAFKSYEKHIKKLINTTDIQYVQWVNFNKNKITLKTLKK